ncbi:class I SAM-dependent methyltransferase [Elioraea thermophila]|uniref:class I SAM-dependent methyltransferase n=1 Tax=Elioraea thermophila TaxID=2185104 RepID=UPI001E5B6DCE|nr:class I SAM-dependent methyltransferase [Elioraea thermophila]
MISDRLKAAVPWWGKIAAKLVLSRLPVGYGTWARANLFRHGTMDRPDRALATFAGIHAVAAAHAPLPSGFTVLELGPGDSLLAAVAAWGFGAGRILACDVGPFATTTLEGLKGLDGLLRARGLRPLPLAQASTAEEALAAMNVRYLTRGVEDLRALPAASVDLVWSNAVLEHVRLADLPATLAELARLLNPDGVMVHGVDFSDHLGGALNNLRFSPRLWEADWFAARSGFYTNRIAPSELLALFAEAGLATEVIHRETWAAIPTPRRALHATFRARSEEDLLTRGLILAARHATA